MKILLQGRVEGELLERLESIIGDEHTYIAPSSREELIEEGKDAEVFFGYCSEDLFPASTQHQMGSILQCWYGSAHVPPLCVRAMLSLTNAAGLYAKHVADQAFALLLGLARGIHESVRNQDIAPMGRYKSYNADD